MQIELCESRESRLVKKTKLEVEREKLAGLLSYPSWWTVARTFALEHALSVIYVPGWHLQYFSPIYVLCIRHQY